MASATLVQSSYIATSTSALTCNRPNQLAQGLPLPIVSKLRRRSSRRLISGTPCPIRALSYASAAQLGSTALWSQFGVGHESHSSTHMSYSYGPSRVPETEADIQKWTLLQVRGWILAAFAATFLLAPGYVFNEVLPNLGKIFKDPRTYPAVWSYGDQARGAVRHLPTLAHFAGAQFFSSAVLDILIARAQSHEALRFKILGDLIVAAILVAYLTSCVVWKFYPRSDLALVVLYGLRGLWDLRIWFEENYAT